MAASVWALDDGELVEHLHRNNEGNAKHWIFEMIESLPHEDFTRVAITLWVIWSSRRKAIHEKKFQSPLSTHGFIISYIKELDSIATPSTRRSNQPMVRGQA
jgi:hypothetical protein